MPSASEVITPWHYRYFINLISPRATELGFEHPQPQGRGLQEIENFDSLCGKFLSVRPVYDVEQRNLAE